MPRLPYLFRYTVRLAVRRQVAAVQKFGNRWFLKQRPIVTSKKVRGRARATDYTTCHGNKQCNLIAGGVCLLQ